MMNFELRNATRLRPGYGRQECEPRDMAPHVSRFTFHVSRSAAGFTMIEIAISLAIIGFALAAIIGILPAGMNVQKENRQETIINQDASILLDAIRNGERGLDDLTNYVMAITNYVTSYNNRGVRTGSSLNAYTYNASIINGAPSSPPFAITNGYRIIGLLTTPKIIPLYNSGAPNGFISNHVVAFVRSMSGPASEKYPQQNDIVRGLGLSYRLMADVDGYGTNYYDRSWTNYQDAAIAPNRGLVAQRFNYFILVTNLANTMHDVRLTFRWPLKPNGDGGTGRQVYRTMVGGWLTSTNEPGFPVYPAETLYFFQPRAYAAQ